VLFNTSFVVAPSPWWRRRLLHKDEESARVPIAFSLRTRDLWRARSIAAQLAVASDAMLRREGREMPLAEFGAYVLLTNFDNYAEWFATLCGAAVKGLDRPMPNVTSDGITPINFGMGSPNAATVMDLLSAIAPKAVLFLSKCGGLKRKNQIWRLQQSLLQQTTFRPAPFFLFPISR
jgi:hypothetical protein